MVAPEQERACSCAPGMLGYQCAPARAQRAETVTAPLAEELTAVDAAGLAMGGARGRWVPAF